MVFFQAMLLLGYLYSHLTTKWLTARIQALVHISLLAIAAATLPIPIDVGSPGQSDPVVWLLMTLLLSVGFPFFIVSTTGPLLQRWFSRTGHAQAHDPYFLYSASNAGSVVGLLAYPALFEPFLTRMQQSWTWAGMYIALAPLVGACGYVMVKQASGAQGEEAKVETLEKGGEASAVTGAALWKVRALWLALAFVPSSLMLGVTQYVTTDVAPIPLLWIIPLLLYLFSFILAFSQRVRISASGWGRAMPLALICVLVAILTGANSPLVLLAGLHLVFFFVVAMMCHKRMAETRPPTSRLTEFYLIMSLGGVLGGIFNAILAPQVFDSIMEYPLIIGAACLLRPQMAQEVAGLLKPIQRFTRVIFAVAVSIFLLALIVNVDAAVVSGALRRPISILGQALHLENGALKSGSTVLLSFATVLGVLRAGIPAVICLLLLIKGGSLRFALAALTLLVGSMWLGESSTNYYQERSFFGVNKVGLLPNQTWVKLSHGTTIHGVQARRFDESGLMIPPPLLSGEERYKMLFETNRTNQWQDEHLEYLPLIPTAYYHSSGPMGEVFKMLAQGNRLKKVALVGLGAGTLAAYAMPGSTFIFYEIDPAVIRIAFPAAGLPYSANHFTYIADAVRDKTTAIGVEEGDARLKLRDTQQGPFDLIVLDAFSSDAIPVHLLTKEAIEMYVSKLKPDGIIAIHISNRYFDLRRPLKRIAHELGLFEMVRNDGVVTKEQGTEGKKESLYLVMARKKSDFGPLAIMPNWERGLPETQFPLWTDDHANVLGALVTEP